MTLDTGNLTQQQLNALLLAIPMDLTFTDENDIIQYFSGRDNLIFSRDPKILGTDVRDCHSNVSMDDVNLMLDQLKSGERDYFEAWHENEAGRFTHTRYIAARDKGGKFIGCLETLQDVTEIRAMSGSKGSME
jgi:uncharacterized protein